VCTGKTGVFTKNVASIATRTSIAPIPASGGESMYARMSKVFGSLER
jgi:hypothetical protein